MEDAAAALSPSMPVSGAIDEVAAIVSLGGFVGPPVSKRVGGVCGGVSGKGGCYSTRWRREQVRWGAE